MGHVWGFRRLTRPDQAAAEEGLADGQPGHSSFNSMQVSISSSQSSQSPRSPPRQGSSGRRWLVINGDFETSPSSGFPDDGAVDGPGDSKLEIQRHGGANQPGWDPYAWAFEAEEDHVRLVFKNPGMEDDPTCGPIIDDIAIKKLFTPEKPKDNAVINGDFEEGPWMFRNTSLGVYCQRISTKKLRLFRVDC
ncbi:hypothetical protein Bca52824_032598 [Brassica carinata]|uniref:DUF642 domain-containing protein n=1 Tax=Brassica carinata TaxID=52824 RepID=A0A8X7V6G1_BRACI|nr:hypothetical protein Bca52824_032598 [Brassica carinata]